MLKHGWSVPFAAAFVFMFMVVGCGEDPAPVYDLAAINFETESVPAGGAGQLYNTVIRFTTSGGAALPDQFELDVGVLPPGVVLSTAYRTRTVRTPATRGCSAIRARQVRTCS